jgi:hypothetical protein
VLTVMDVERARKSAYAAMQADWMEPDQGQLMYPHLGSEGELLKQYQSTEATAKASAAPMGNLICTRTSLYDTPGICMDDLTGIKAPLAF